MAKILKFQSLVLYVLLMGCSYEKQHQAAVLPISSPILFRKAYYMEYDGQHRQARWVYQKLTASNLNKIGDRQRCEFQEDPDLPYSLRAIKQDYKGFNFDQGHLCPAADSSFDYEALQETFYLSNVTPQLPRLNRGQWRTLEKYTREKLKEYQTVHVYTGPLYLSHQESDGKSYVTYQVIGPNQVAVPTHYFKVLFLESSEHIKAEAYILPNQLIDTGTALSAFQVPLEEVEKKAGIVFPQLR